MPPSLICGRLLLALVVCCLLSKATKGANPPLTSSVDCPYLHLPSDFNSITYLGVNGEFHSYNTYYYDFTQQEYDITFNVSVETAIRVYFAPHTVDIDMWLYRGSNYITYTTDVGSDEAILATIPPGSYKLALLFYGIYKMVGVDCPTLTMEVEMIPTSVLSSRVNQLACPPTMAFPVLNFASLTTQNFYYYDTDINDTNTIFSVQDNPGDNIIFINKYTFTVPLASATDAWALEVTLGTHFLTGGSLGLLLQDSPSAPIDKSCFSIGNCSLGVHNSRGDNTIKQLLTPGTYDLYIFDEGKEKNSSLSRCNPFSLKVDIHHATQTENYLSCPFQELPSSFNDTGYIDEDGFLFYRQHLLANVSKTTRSVSWRVAAQSYLRVYTAEHRIDLDIYLYNADTNTLLTYSIQWGGEEIITQLLQPSVNYRLVVSFFGSYTPVFCESYLLEVAISPVSLYSGVNLCAYAANTPDLTGLPFSLRNTSNPNIYKYGSGQVFTIDYGGNYDQRTVVSQSFSILVSSYIKAELGANFLLGDLRVWLVQGTQSPQLGDHRRNLHYLDAVLPVGNYTLSVVTGDQQSVSQVGFPTCAAYTLNIEIAPTTPTTSVDCLFYRHFPSTLLNPQFLASSPKVHFQETFLIPAGQGSTSVTRETTFNVTTASYLRIYISPHIVDIDIYLYENGFNVASGFSFNEEEAVSYMLKPGAKYSMLTRYYFWSWNGPFDAPCYTYPAEFAIEPVIGDEAQGGQPCAADNMPVASLIPVPTAAGFHHEASYQFSQGVRTRTQDLPFSVPAGTSVLFRAEVVYDFAWNDLSVMLVNANRTSEVTAQGVMGYNREEIPTTLLPAGFYFLRIYEPFDTNTPGQILRNCVEFDLTLGMQLVGTSDSDAAMEMCADDAFPPTFNSPAFLSNLTGSALQFARSVLVDVVHRTDHTDFAVAVTSVLRVYVPQHATVDVDVYLYSGTYASHSPTPKAYQISYGEEIIHILLEPGQYTLVWIYYPFYNGPPLPPPEQCVTFPVIITLYPEDTLRAVPQIRTPCDSVNPPTQLIGNQVVGGTFTRSLAPGPFHTELVFTVNTTVSSFLVNLRYFDPALGLAMVLYGSNLKGVAGANKVYYPLYEANHAYFDEILYQGSYSLNITDPASYQTQSSNPDSGVLKCAMYSLSYFANSTVMLPIDACDDTQVLPTQLTPLSDGSIRIFADNLYMSKDPKQRHHYVTFTVTQLSFMRIFGNADDSDVDFWLYQIVGGDRYLVDYSIGTASKESALWQLPPMSYYLDIDYFKVSSRACTYWQFELAIKPNTTIQQELLCPAVLPNESDQVPPNIFDLTGGYERNTYGTNYMFTSMRIASGTTNRVFRYRMTIRVTDTPMIILASIGFDFLANDFTLELTNANTNAKVLGTPDAAANRDSYVNFVNSLGFELSGNTTYYLDITEPAEAVRLGPGQFCHYFEFQFLAYQNSGPPKVINVNPHFAYDIDPSKDLDLAVIFSEAVSLLESQLGGFLQSSRAITLSNNTHTLLPSNYATHSGGSILDVTFSGAFAAGATYSLALNASAFTTSYGVPFTSQVFPFYQYMMFLCDCHGKGSCIQPQGTEDWVCQCNFPWAGYQCDDCAPGYHGAGTQCVQNTVCSNTSCNGHGRCNDRLGYITCTCNPGYESDGVNFCARCAPGYSGFPNCTIADPDTDRPVYCAAPILPSSLNGPGYLGVNQRTHISGEYYVDMATNRHDVSFTLQNSSLFRVYVEPHWLDVDIWLNAILPDGSSKMIQYEGSFNGEESIYTVLAPGPYEITFRYYQWVTGRDTSCETFLLELAIVPVDSTTNEAAVVRTQYCQSASVLPPNAPLNIAQPYTFSSTHPFTVNAVNKTSNIANYFWSMTFTIAPGATQIASFTATLGYRFALGDLALLLEPGTLRWHCNNTDNQLFPVNDPGCIYGHDDYDTNSLHQLLRAGAYTLWIYEPVPQNASLSTCSVFDFTLNVQFLDEEADVFDCDGTPVPTSLDSVEYTLPDGSIHFVDHFLMNGADPHTVFTVSQPSLFRVSATSMYSGDITLQLLNQAGATVGLPADNNAGDLYASLVAGQYTLHFISHFISASSCPIALVELALMSVADVAPVSTCPTTTTSPILQPTAIPFYYGPVTMTPDTVWYATYSVDRPVVVASYTFTVSQTAVLETGLSSNFAQFDLRLALYHEETLVASSIHDYNMNVIFQELSAGTYILQLQRPPVGYTNPSPLPQCSPYNLIVYLGYVASQVCVGDYLPSSFNTVRFLGTDDTMNFQSNNFVIPYNITSLYRTHQASLMVHSERMLRVYVEPHIVDIDIAVLLNSTGEILAQGSNGIGPEETFTYILSPNVSYIFQVRYWMWNSANILQCNTYNMEMAIGPVTPLPALCPGGGANNWIPAIPNSAPNTPYAFDSVAATQNLYFQQRIGHPSSFSSTFSLTGPADFHAEIGYDFLRGDVVMMLTATTTGDVFYGANRPNRNVLNVANLPQGSYTLTIYEPTVTQVRVIGCAHFTFEIFIQAAAVTLGRTHYLPTSLNSIAYTLLDGRTHLAGIYTLWDGSGHDAITFTVTQNSVLRVDTSVSDDEDIVSTVPDSILAPFLTLSTSTKFVGSGIGGFIQLLVPDTYTLSFVASPAMGKITAAGLALELELAIDTVSHMQADIAQYAPPTCVDSSFYPIVPNPAGHFQDQESPVTVSYATLSSSVIIKTLPFTLTRYSRIYVQLSTQFLTSDFMLVLSSNDAKVWIFGRQGRNIDEINAEVPPGSYNLQIIQHPGGMFTPAMNLPHCGMFEYAIVVKDATDSGDIVCSTLDLVPWTLDTFDGGSSPYGGPIDGSGNLHLYGSSFYIPRRSQDSLTFNITTPSLFSILTIAPSSKLDYLVSTNTNAIVTPLQNSLSPTGLDQRLALFYINAAPSYELDIIYRSRASVTCPAYALQINMKPVSALKTILACPTSQPVTPSLTFDQGFASNVVTSYFVSSKNATVVIAFSLTKRSHITTSLAFNSLATTFTLGLFSHVGEYTSTYGYGEWQPQQENSGLTTLSQTYSNDVNPGNYSIRISSVPLSPTSPLVDSQLCFPFVWSASVNPVGAPYVSDVTLSSAVDINPYAVLSFAVIFSTHLYDASHNPATSQTVQSAFILSGSNGKDVAPASAVSLNDVTKWQLTFASGTLANSTTYKLKLNAPLFDVYSSLLYLSPTHLYSTADTSCSNHGVYDTVRGECVCTTAYAGVLCKSCAANFHDISETGNNPICVAQVCGPNTCGCDPTEPKWCVSLGVCSMSPANVPVCKCTAGYEDSTWCGSCAVGYTGYPLCRAYHACDPPCANGGTCDTDDGTCDCPANFAGTSCQSCAPDYSGDNCKDYKAVPDSWSTTRTFLGITAAILVVAGAAVAAVWYIRRRGFGGRYRLLPRFDADDDDEAAPLPMYDNQFGDDDEAPPQVAGFNTDNIGAALGGDDQPSAPGSTTSGNSPRPPNINASPSTSSPAPPSPRTGPAALPSGAFSINDGDSAHSTHSILDM